MASLVKNFENWTALQLELERLQVKFSGRFSTYTVTRGPFFSPPCDFSYDKSAWFVSKMAQH